MKDLTKGKETKVLLTLTLPMFISVIFQQMYNIADSIIAGRFVGENALAAIGASYPIVMIFMTVAFGCNIGCSVVISTLFGEKNNSKLKCAVYTTIISAFVLSVVLSALGLVSSKAMLRAIHTPDNIFDDANLYQTIYFWGLPFIFIYNVVNGIFTAVGDSRTPLYFLIGSSVSNIILDIVFVGVFDFGVAGVAWATFIAQGLSGILSSIMLYFVIRKIKTDKFKIFSFEMLSRLSKMAVPSILQQSFISIGNILIQSVINIYGSGVIAGFSAAIKLNTFAITSFLNLSNGVSTFCAQNLGAKLYKRVTTGLKQGLKIGIFVLSPFLLAYFFFTKLFISMFLENPTDIAISTGVRMLKILSPFYPLVAAKIILNGALRGIGRIKAFMTATFTDLALRVIFVYTVSHFFGINAVFFGWPFGWIIGFTLSILLWNQSVKKYKNKDK